MTATSLDCSGATSCFTVKATFLRLFHFSGNSWTRVDRENKEIYIFLKSEREEILSRQREAPVV